MNNNDTQRIRQAIIKSLPIEVFNSGQIPEQHEVYQPASHLKALRLECNLVIGARGVGKSFWSAALQSESIRKMLGKTIPDLSRVSVWTGFGLEPKNEVYPDSDTFDSLIKTGIEPYLIWRAVLARWLADHHSGKIPCTSWNKTIAWVDDNTESFSRMLERANTKFKKDGLVGVIVFDALDRSSSNWRNMDMIVRDLLRVVLSLNRFPHLRGKVFLREDQYAGRQVTDFPDASKLLATRANLTWALPDLHGMLWQRLCNGPDDSGNALRGVYKHVVGTPPEQTPPGVWILHDVAKRESEIQRSLFMALAGKWMGKDQRRGYPYTWTVGHLADGRGRTSPRSYLAAIRAAAEDSFTRYPEHPFPLHYDSIKRGVQNASEIRVKELEEDYRWVKKPMEPLGGLVVPCPFGQVKERWETQIHDPATIYDGKGLPPEHLEEGWDGIRKDLVKLGVFETMKDGRVNMPDLYRVGFGLGRRGGVRPVARAS